MYKLINTEKHTFPIFIFTLKKNTANINHKMANNNYDQK